jgi:hypothetical protein
MKLNQLPNFRVEDFPSENSWIGKLFVQLNPFIQAINQVLDNHLDFTSNIPSVIRQYTITEFQAFSFQWPHDTEPVDLRVTKALKGSQQTPTILLAAWSYDGANSLVRVSQMVEVSSSGVSALSGRYQFWIRASV